MTKRETILASYEVVDHDYDYLTFTGASYEIRWLWFSGNWRVEAPPLDEQLNTESSIDFIG